MTKKNQTNKIIKEKIYWVMGEFINHLLKQKKIHVKHEKFLQI